MYIICIFTFIEYIIDICVPYLLKKMFIPYCILTYDPFGRCPGVVSLDYMVVLSLAF
jgi:hypothetical protein